MLSSHYITYQSRTHDRLSQNYIQKSLSPTLMVAQDLQQLDEICFVRAVTANPGTGEPQCLLVLGVTLNIIDQLKPLTT